MRSLAYLYTMRYLMPTLLLLILPLITSSSPVMNDTIRVVFYNVENLFDTIDDPATDDDFFLPASAAAWDSERYELKVQRLAEVIASMASGRGDLPSIIGLAEVENAGVLTDLCASGRLAAAGYAFIHKDSPDERGIDVALLYRQGMFTPLASEALRVEPGGEDRTRDILHVEGLLGGENRIHLYINHWPSRREGREATEHKRIAAARVLRGSVDAILESDPGARIVIMGDFNDEPDNRSLDEVLNARIPGQDEGAGLYNLAYKAYLRGEGTYYYRQGKEWNFLDQFIVSAALLEGKEGLHCPSKGMDIHRKDFFLYRNKENEAIPNRTYSGANYFGGYSDHLPVFIELFAGDQ